MYTGHPSIGTMRLAWLDLGTAGTRYRVPELLKIFMTREIFKKMTTTIEAGGTTFSSYAKKKQIYMPKKYSKGWH